MKVLILGGTRDAKTLALELHNKGIDVTYSIAGLVRQPDLPCNVISGGFSIRGGLKQYIVDNQITDLLDATHPFATTMSHTAAQVAAQLGIRFEQYRRPDWIAKPDDNWLFFNNWGDLVSALSPYQSIFLTQGQLSATMLATLAQHRKPQQHFVYRTAVRPKHQIPEWLDWLEGIGPFSLENELRLLKNHHVDVLVSKHSGGDIPAKLIAARSLKIPVLLIQRPENKR